MAWKHLALLGICVFAVGCPPEDDPEPNDEASSNDSPNNGGTNEIVRPEVINPCDVLDVAEVSAAMGAEVAVTESSFVNRSAFCTWSIGGLPSAVSLHATVSRFTSIEGETEDWTPYVGGAAESEELSWSPNGRLWVTNGDPQTGALRAYIINTDPLGRHVILDMFISPEFPEMGDPIAPPVADQKAILQTIGERSSDVIREGQPEGVELPVID